jgi:ribosomal protein L9
MKKKIEYSDLPPGGDPIGELEIIEDFLPPPEELVFKKPKGGHIQKTNHPVTSAEIADALKEHGIDIQEKQITPKSIDAFGESLARIQLPSGLPPVNLLVTVQVETKP